MDNQTVAAIPSEPSVAENSPKKSNWPISILLIFLFLFGLFGAYYFGKSAREQSAITPQVSPTALIQPSPTETQALPSPTSSPVATGSAVMGTVSGKLCYPSEMLPKGTIEAKNTISGEIVILDYPGSEVTSSNTYEVGLELGTYYLRYKVSDSLIGYHTETCKTGLETSCNSANPRVLIPATVETGKTVPNYDLCDFYYSDSTKPVF